jgi:hypothetical protein
MPESEVPVAGYTVVDKRKPKPKFICRHCHKPIVQVAKAHNGFGHKRKADWTGKPHKAEL